MIFRYRNVYAKFDAELGRVRTYRSQEQHRDRRGVDEYRATGRIGYEILAVDPTHQKAPVIVMFVPRRDKP